MEPKNSMFVETLFPKELANKKPEKKSPLAWKRRVKASFTNSFILLVKHLKAGERVEFQKNAVKGKNLAYQK